MNDAHMRFNDILFQMFNLFWDGFVDESCRAQMLQPAACLYGEMGEELRFCDSIFRRYNTEGCTDF